MYQRPETSTVLATPTGDVGSLTNKAKGNQHPDYCVRCSRRTGSVNPEPMYLRNCIPATITVCAECGFKKFIIWT